MNTKRPVSERALIARVNRKIRGDEEVVRVGREDSQWFNDTGRHYIVNLRSNALQPHIDLEAYAREVGVLRPYEVLKMD